MLKVEGKNFDWKNIDLMQCLQGNALDAFYTLKVYTKLLEEIRKTGLEKLYDKLISPLTTVFRDIEYNGMDIDKNKLESLKKELLDKMETIKTKMVDSKYIPNNYKLSGDNLIGILFSLVKGVDPNTKKKSKDWIINEDIGFGLYPVSRTESGQPCTAEEDMTKLKELVDREFLSRGLNEAK